MSNIIISGGGTGGHLFPALAIAQALKKIDENINILFVGAKGKIEEKKVPEAGFDIKLLQITGFPRKISFESINFIFKLLKSLRKSNKIIQNFNPDVAVGVGGYASGPLVFKAAGKKIPILLQEQNSYPGITNKILSKYANKICVAYDEVKSFFPKEKILKTGNPVREKLLETNITRKKAAEFFELNPNKKIILSLGGSGGAKIINNSISNGLDKIVKADIQIIWQTGKFYFENSKEKADKINSENVKVLDFITRMDLAFKACDLVISRAGAGTISELCLLEKPTILIPSPNVAADHQTKNAMALVNKNAAVLVKDIQAEKKLIKTAIEIVNNKEKLTKLAENIKKEAIRNSAEIIAKEVIKLINLKN